MTNNYTLALALMLQLACMVHANEKPAEVTTSDMQVTYKTMRVIYKKSMLVVRNKDGVAAIMFDKPIVRGITYRYRFLPKGQSKEKTGEGRVFEKEKIIWSFLFISSVENDGGKLVVKAGPISLTWSLCERGSGWIYFNLTRMYIEMADPKDFDRIDLRVREKSK